MKETSLSHRNRSERYYVGEGGHFEYDLQFFPLNFKIKESSKKLESITKFRAHKTLSISERYPFTATKAKIKGREIYLPSSSQQVEPVSLTSFRIAFQFDPKKDFQKLKELNNYLSSTKKLVLTIANISGSLIVLNEEKFHFQEEKKSIKEKLNDEVYGYNKIANRTN